jgi:hypothetical protein
MFNPFSEITANSRLRVLRLDLVNNDRIYRIQKKFLFWWVNATEMIGYGAYGYIQYDNYGQAVEFCRTHEKNKDYRKTLKVKKTTVV